MSTSSRQWHPIHLDIMLAAYTGCLPRSNPSSPAFQQAIRDLRQRNMIEYDPTSQFEHTATEKGRTFVNLLCETPEPISKWLDPRRQ